MLGGETAIEAETCAIGSWLIQTGTATAHTGANFLCDSKYACEIDLPVFTHQKCVAFVLYLIDHIWHKLVCKWEDKQWDRSLTINWNTHTAQTTDIDTPMYKIDNYYYQTKMPRFLYYRRTGENWTKIANMHNVCVQQCDGSWQCLWYPGGTN